MSDLREAFEELVADVPRYGDLDRALQQHQEERRRRVGVVVGLAAVAAVLAVIAGILATSRGTHSAPPVSPLSPDRSQSPQTWADSKVSAKDLSADGEGWNVPDPMKSARDSWFRVLADHLDPTGEHFSARAEGEEGSAFTWPDTGSIYPAEGGVGLIADSAGTDPSDGCAYFLEGRPSPEGIESCSEERFAGPDGQDAQVARYQRRCGSWDPGQEGDDARPGPGSTYELCGDYEVAVSVERRDGLIGYLLVRGRGTPAYNPFPPSVMAAAAADPRLTIPEEAFAVPSPEDVEAVVQDHFPRWVAGRGRSASRASAFGWSDYLMGALADSGAEGRLGRTDVSVRVLPADGAPTCGARRLLGCVERRVYGEDDPTTVYVGAWEVDGLGPCCPKGSRSSSREFVFVGVRHTVVVRETRLVRAGEESLSAALDKRLIDLVLDPRLQ